jgi:hypothetical protein
MEGAIGEYKPGEATAEFGQLAHGWKNNGSVPAVLYSAVLYSADILPPEMDNHDTM